MHGPNFTRPTPELIDGEEEYSVEKILDSRHFGRRRCLQYLVKWEGYPDADNMWVDKDDVFADDKVREFKHSNPDAATHIRSTSFAKSPYPPTTTRSKLLYHHALSCMSSDGNTDLAYEYPAGAVAGLEASLGATTTMTHQNRSHSNGSATEHDLRRCARCREQNQYCHGHTPVIPNPSLDLPPTQP
jgi:hypothetical protein